MPQLPTNWKPEGFELSPYRVLGETFESTLIDEAVEEAGNPYINKFSAFTAQAHSFANGNKAALYIAREVAALNGIPELRTEAFGTFTSQAINIFEAAIDNADNADQAIDIIIAESRGAIITVAENAAITALTAIPVYGVFLAIAAKAAKMLISLAVASRQRETPVYVYSPVTRYTKAADELWANAILSNVTIDVDDQTALPTVAPNGRIATPKNNWQDIWTPTYSNPLFRAESVSAPEDRTEVIGRRLIVTRTDSTSSAIDPFQPIGLGYLPGLTHTANAWQRLNSQTKESESPLWRNTAEFTPSGNQIVTQLWAQINKNSVDCFKVQPEAMISLWQEYFFRMHSSREYDWYDWSCTPQEKEQTPGACEDRENNPPSQGQGQGALFHLDDIARTLFLIDYKDGTTELLAYDSYENLLKGTGVWPERGHDPREGLLMAVEPDPRLMGKNSQSNDRQIFKDYLETIWSEKWDAGNEEGRFMMGIGSLPGGKELFGDYKQVRWFSLYYYIEFILKRLAANQLRFSRSITSAYIDDTFAGMFNPKIIANVEQARTAILQTQRGMNLVEPYMIPPGEFRNAVINAQQYVMALPPGDRAAIQAQGESEEEADLPAPFPQITDTSLQPMPTPPSGGGRSGKKGGSPLLFVAAGAAAALLLGRR